MKIAWEGKLLTDTHIYRPHTINNEFFLKHLLPEKIVYSNIKVYLNIVSPLDNEYLSGWVKLSR